MKPGSHLITAIAIFLSLNVSAQTASEYMYKISLEYKDIAANTWDYTSAIAHDKSARKIEKRRTELLTAIKTAKRNIKQMMPFNGSTRLRDSAAAYLDVNYKVLNEDYSKIVDMEKVADESYEAMEEYLLSQDEATKKLNEAGEMIEREQHKFAEENDVTINEGDTKLSLKFKKTKEVVAYNRIVYLIFFKCYVQEKHLLEALNKEDVEGLKKSSEAMTKYSDEGLQKLKSLGDYEGDKSLIESGSTAMKFFADEADKARMMIYLFEKKQAFEKAKAEFESKKEKDRTQSDVDHFNTAVNEYNKAIEDFNKMNEMLNKERQKQIENYNKSSSKFLSKHTPRGKG